MGNLAPDEFDSTDQARMIARLREALENARFICDGPIPTRLGILIEEVCELADDVVDGEEYRAELVQVAAMSLAWLGVDPSDTARPQLRAHLEGHRIVVDTPVELQMTNDGFWDGESLTLTVGPGRVPIKCMVQLPSTQTCEAGESQCG